MLKLETNRMNLIEIEMKDMEDIHRLHSIPEVDEFNTLGIPEDLLSTKRLVEEMVKETKKSPQKSYSWKIMLKEKDIFIGMAGMNLSGDRFRIGEIYYKLVPKYWGKGYATEISKKLINIGFDHFNLHRIEAGVATENKNSIKVLKKSGMIFEGIRRKILPIRGAWKDNYEYAIIEDDPREE